MEISRSPGPSGLDLGFSADGQREEIRNQLVEQFKCLEQQSESRIQLLQDLQEFFRRKAEIELEYSRSLEKLAERFSSKIRSSREHQQFKKDQHLLSSVNCWYLVLTQARRESRDHATLGDIYTNNVIVRLAQIGEDVIRLFKKSKEIGIQMHEELVKVTNELYTVMKTYHMYHTESISAESKLKDAEKQEEKQFSKSGDLNVNLLRHDDRQPRRGFVRKIEKMKEKRQAKYSENKLKCTKARNDYLLNLAATNAVVAKYYIHDVSDMIDRRMRMTHSAIFGSRKKNSSEFSRLIAQVRGRRETNKPARNTREDAVKEENSAEAHAADKVEPTQCRLPIKVEDRGSDEDPSATSNEWPPSPTSSDVSISSSLSDIFGPEPAANLEETTRTAVHKRRSRSRKEDADASPVPGKRRRKT
ncbi:hypothetical protein fugu_005185 [Takifugu bimaculatus]|uniref:F-BAR domain-containing protein n=1 Tax=Takifugu bimaculatus TaxID=433685 RepID=A0A4Z2B936_9TELE|nr:hypothetical protein fugu_005185 [Takifugu bimaculatus]